MKKKIMLFGIIILFFSPYLQAQVNVIDTVATTTNFPFDLAVNSVGDVYFLEQPAPFFLDQWHQSPDLKVIRHGSSVVETVFSVGEFPSIGSIDGITIDQSDEVYGVSGGNTRIWKLRNSTPVELSNLRQFSSTGFDLAVDQEGNILIPDGNPGLKMFYPDSRRSSTIANGSSGSNGITLSSTGQVYASNLTEGVRGFSLSYGEDGFSRTPSEIIAGGGTDRSLTTAIPAIEADLTCPTPIECKKRLAIDREGNLLIADPGRHVIRKLTSDGLLMTIAGDGEAAYSGDNGSPTSARLNSPEGVAIDPRNGDIYIADSRNRRIRRIYAAPDLVISYARVVRNNPSTSDVAIVFTNRGEGAAAGPFRIRINTVRREGRSPAPLTLTVLGSGTLAARESRTLNLSVPTGDLWMLTIDARNNVAESNESNNHYTLRR